MSQADSDIQLKVWKDLAISKQILMGAATDALGLDAECSTSDLREALNRAIKRAKDADIIITKTREETSKDIAAMKALVESSDKARVLAEEQIEIAEKAREAAERQLSIGKAENLDALKKARAEVADKQNKLKAISKSLADTPENVVKKLKNLKKQKLDETRLRTQAEAKLLATRKEKTKLEAELEVQTSLVEKTGPLVAQVRDLHAMVKQQNKKIKSLSDDKNDLVKVAKLDEELLEAFEKPDSDEKT